MRSKWGPAFELGIVSGAIILACLAVACGKQPDKPQREPEARRYSQVATIVDKGSLNNAIDLQELRLRDGTRCIALVPRFMGSALAAISCEWRQHKMPDVEREAL